MSGKEEQKADRRENSGNPEAGRLELQISANHSAQQEEWCQHGNPLGEAFETRRLDAHDILGAQPGFLAKFVEIGGDALCEQRLAVVFLDGFLGAQGQQRALSD